MVYSLEALAQTLPIEGEPTIHLRRTELADSDWLFQVVHDNPYMKTYQDWSNELVTPQAARTSVAEVLRSMELGEWLQYRVVEGHPNEKGTPARMLGTITLYDHDPDRSHAWLGYWLAEAAQGHGYASRGAQSLTQYGQQLWGIESVAMAIARGNTASEKVAQRLGALPNKDLMYKSDIKKLQWRAWSKDL